MLDSWFANLKISGSHLQFKIVTGANITVISLKMYKNLWNRLPLRQPEGRFRSSGGTLLCKENS